MEWSSHAQRLPVALPVTALAAPGPGLQAADRTRVLIDADTANEVDDPYAIVRALIAPELEVVGLAAAQWQVSHWTTPTSMRCDSGAIQAFRSIVPSR